MSLFYVRKGNTEQAFMIPEGFKHIGNATFHCAGDLSKGKSVLNVPTLQRSVVQSTMRQGNLDGLQNLGQHNKISLSQNHISRGTADHRQSNFTTLPSTCATCAWAGVCWMRIIFPQPVKFHLISLKCATCSIGL